MKIRLYDEKTKATPQFALEQNGDCVTVVLVDPSTGLKLNSGNVLSLSKHGYRTHSGVNSACPAALNSSGSLWRLLNPR